MKKKELRINRKTVKNKMYKFERIYSLKDFSEMFPIEKNSLTSVLSWLEVQYFRNEIELAII